MKIYVSTLRKFIDTLGKPSPEAWRLWQALNFDLLHGRVDAVKGRELASHLGLTGDAEIRALVNELVRLRFPVFSAIGNPPGYYIAGNIAEAQEGLNNRLSRIREQAAAYRALEKTTAALYGPRVVSGDEVKQLDLIDTIGIGR